MIMVVRYDQAMLRRGAMELAAQAYKETAGSKAEKIVKNLSLKVRKSGG